MARDILDVVSEAYCAQHERFLFTKNQKSSTSYMKATKSANSNSSCCFSGPAAALTPLPKGVSHSHPREKNEPKHH